jgi:acid phosphatase type 7
VLGAVAGGTWIEIDLSSIVTAAGTYSFAITGGSTAAVDYSSREGSSPAQLVITTAGP